MNQRFRGFIGPTYESESINFECQRCINLYPELDENHTGKDGEQFSFVGTPGLTLLGTAGNGPIRGLWYTSTGQLFAVSGNTVYTVSSTGTAVSVGTLLTSTGNVGMADNGALNGTGVLVIVDGPNGYYVNLANPVAVTQITSISWLGSNRVTYQDGYFIFVAPNSSEFYLSDLNAITFNAPAETAKNGYPDNIVAHIAVNRNLWLLGDVTTEVWFDSGNNTNPFQYISGTLAQFGCAAASSVAIVNNTICWLGKDVTGMGMVFTANGYQPQRISNHSIERQIQTYPTIADAIGFSYQEKGHQFYILTFPSGNATWAYDFETQLWHERAYLSNGTFQRIRANCYAHAYGMHIVGDYQTGNIYQMSSTVYTDNGNAILRQRVSPHISNNMNRVFYNSFQLDIETGIGLDGTGQGTAPLCMLDWSDDGGHKWSDQMTASIGKIGSSTTRTIFRRLGTSRNRVFRVGISDPVPVRIMGAELELQMGVS